MALGQLRAGVEAHQLGPDAHLQPLADVARRDRVQALLDLRVAIPPHLGRGPGHDLDGVVGKASMADCSIVWNTSSGGACVVP